MTRLHCAGPLACLLLVGYGHSVQADDLSRRLDDPRSVGRAGATNVSGDTGAALFHNPGGMVRRSQPRLLLSTGLGDTDASFASEDRPTSPAIGNRVGPQMAPMLAYHHGLADGRWVVGVAFLHREVRSSLPTPAFGQPAADVERLFPHRYGGTQLSQRFRTFGFGAAIRIGESVGLGASASISQTAVQETRRVWAGFAGRDPLLGPERDLELVLRGEDLYAPGASLGALIAPPELPVEFALSVEYRRGAHLRPGKAELRATSSAAFPEPQAARATSELRRKDSLILRSGARYLGARSFVEVAADWQVQDGNSREEWQVEGMRVVDESTAVGEVLRVPALVHSRSHLALRAAVDYEVVLGFLWLTCGYAWTSPGSPQHVRTPVYAGLGGHTLAAGLEASYENYIFSLGYARTLRRVRSVSSGSSDVPAFNPFDAGSAPANAGTHESSADRLGFAVEVSWD